MRQALSAEKKASKKQSLKMEANLVAAVKTNAELEVCAPPRLSPVQLHSSNLPFPPCAPQRTIEALKLKNVIEKDTLNNMHMKTIKVGRSGNTTVTLWPLHTATGATAVVAAYCMQR